MRDPRSFALVGLGLLCAFLAGGVVFRADRAEAQQSPTYGTGAVDSNNRFIAATGSVGSGMSVLWLVDSEGKRVLVYGTNNLGKSVEFRAARNIEWDLKVDSMYDDSQYSVEDMRRIAEKMRQGGASEKPEKAPPANPPGGGK
jgi:hypothetical protein